MIIDNIRNEDIEPIVDIYWRLKDEDFFYKRDVIQAKRDYKNFIHDELEYEEYFACKDKKGNIIGAIGYRQDTQAEGVYYLSHFVVDPDIRSRGIGSKMLDYIEDVLYKKGARVLVSWTSDSDYALATRHFYEKRGFVLEATVPDYWKDGDNLAIYYKRLRLQ